MLDVKPVTFPEALPREEPYGNWLAWVVSNFGDDPNYASIGANAAADAAFRGHGFNAAAVAATNAWIEAAGDDKPLWRPGFWSLLVTNWYFWGLLVLLITIPLYWVAPQLSLFALLTPLALIAVGWHPMLAMVLPELLNPGA